MLVQKHGDDIVYPSVQKCCSESNVKERKCKLTY